MPAFAAAVAEGADVIETDVHWTADGVLVVAHDPVVETVSDGCGRIDEMTFQALRELDFGYRFSPDGGQTYPFRGKGVMIPTFLELLHAWPNVRVNVDLKPKRARVPAFLEVVDQASAFDRVTLASFHHRTLAEARSRCPKLATSASTREVVEFLAGIPTWKARLGLGRKVPYVALQVPKQGVRTNRRRRPVRSQGQGDRRRSARVDCRRSRRDAPPDCAWRRRDCHQFAKHSAQDRAGFSSVIVR